MELKAEELKQQFDHMQAYSKGYADALQWIANRLAQGEKINGDAVLESSKTTTEASK